MGCNAEHEQVNRHLEHQQERPEGQKDKLNNRRERFSLQHPQDPSLGQSMWKAAEQGRLQMWWGVNRRPHMGGHQGLGCLVRIQDVMLITVKIKWHPWARVHGTVHAHRGDVYMRARMQVGYMCLHTGKHAAHPEAPPSLQCCPRDPEASDPL